MSKHTPGPWVAKFEEAYYVTGPDLGRVAMMMNLKGPHGLGGRRSGEESAANVRLIAAAPDLLAACKAMLACCYDLDRNDETLAAVKTTMAAIAKATGEMP